MRHVPTSSRDKKSGRPGGRPSICSNEAWILEVVLDREADRTRSLVAGRTLVRALGFTRTTAVLAEGRATDHVLAELVDGGDRLLVRHVEHVDLEHQVAVGEGRTVGDVQELGRASCGERWGQYGSISGVSG